MRTARAALGAWLLIVGCCRVVHGQSAPLPPGTSESGTASGQESLAAPSTGLGKAENQMEAKDYAGAASLLDPYLAQHPGDARALFDRGYVENAQGHTAAAESYYRRAIAADGQQFESRLALGLILATRSGANPATTEGEARTELEAATQLTPNPLNPSAQAQAYRALARLLRASDPGGSRQALLEALKLSPQTPEDTLLTAEIAEAAGDPETAAQAYKAALQAAPASDGDSVPAEAVAGLVHLLIEEHKYAEAEALLTESLRSRPADLVLNSQLATVLVAEGKPEPAKAVLEKLHSGQPEDPNIARLLAEVYSAIGEPAKADPLYVQLLAAPGSPDPGLLAARGDNLVRLKRYAEAIPILKQATALDPQNGAAWSSLAFAASESHEPQLTLDALAMRSKVMEETPATYFLQATSWDTLHQRKRAAEMYKQFLAVAGGKFPDEEWQARHRLVALSR